MWISPKELDIFKRYLEKHFPFLTSYLSKNHIRILYLVLMWITGEKKGEMIWHYIESDWPFLEWITCFMDCFLHFHLIHMRKKRWSYLFIKSFQFCLRGKKFFLKRNYKNKDRLIK
jgi:hypothetical protein